MTNAFIPQVAVIDFNHHRGPEVEFWVGSNGKDLSTTNDWASLPFFALPDGAHAVAEEFSYFTLLSKSSDEVESPQTPGSTLFGVACTRQIRADKLKTKSAEVTRSTVQKAVIVIVERPGALGQLRERLAAVTAAWFAQEDFTDTEILKEFQDSLERDAAVNGDGNEHYFGLSLRELIYDLRYQSLALFKALLLQKKVLFFSSRCERLCMTQFALVSLIPNLMQNLQDCADPSLDSYSSTVTRVVNLRTSERSSLLAYMGLPLQIFGKNAFFSPYTPLQQFDNLSSTSSQSYVAGSTNTLLLGQKDQQEGSGSNRYCDILVNLDEAALGSKVTIFSQDLRSAVSLTAADRRWIDHLAQTILDTWNPADPSRPTTHTYTGSEDSVRLLFEEYILSLLSSTAYKTHLDTNPNSYLTSSSGTETHRYPDPTETAADFNPEFLKLWHDTPNYKLWSKLTSDSIGIFDLVEPRHPTSGGLNIEDVQRRVGAAVAELHLDERVRQGRETAGRALEAGRERVGMGVARFWKEYENFKEKREQSRTRKDAEDRDQTQTSATEITSTTDRRPSGTANSATPPPTSSASPAAAGWVSSLRDKEQIAAASAAARENAAKAGAYLSSWGSWARERSKDWNKPRTSTGGTSEADATDSMKRDLPPTSDPNTPVSPGAVAAAQSAMGFPGLSRKATGNVTETEEAKK